MFHSPRADNHIVMARALIDLIVFEYSFDNANGQVRVITPAEMLASLTHLDGFVRGIIAANATNASNNFHQLGVVLDVLPTASLEQFSYFIAFTQYLPSILPYNWTTNFNTHSQIYAQRCPTDVVMRNYERRLSRQRQNQVAAIIASLRTFWNINGAGGEIMVENRVPVAHLYRRTMQNRLNWRAIRRIVDSLHI